MVVKAWLWILEPIHYALIFLALGLIAGYIIGSGRNTGGES